MVNLLPQNFADLNDITTTQKTVVTLYGRKSDGTLIALQVDDNGVLSVNSLGGTEMSGETPTGNIDGINNIFTLLNPPIPSNTASAVKVFSDGIRINPSEYTISSSTLTFSVGSINIPKSSLLVDYSY